GKLWNEITESYNQKGRHYHDLKHLENLLAELEACRSFIQDWNAVLFVLIYHDIVYKATRSDNEAQSAVIAQERLQSFGVGKEMTDKVCDYILATKSHDTHQDMDCNLFTDADLSILGKGWEDYERYTQQVRQEYKIFPDLLYKPGRKKVLRHFLAMPRIYKTDFFFERYEDKARTNLERELEQI
ncbi:MAG: hypothetical protein AB8F95_18300, partial [Bacteroidia bacterium]